VTRLRFLEPCTSLGERRVLQIAKPHEEAFTLARAHVKKLNSAARLSLTVSLGAALAVIALGWVERHITTVAALAIGVMGSTYLGHLVDRGVARGAIPKSVSGFVIGALGFGSALAVPILLLPESEPGDGLSQMLLTTTLGGLFTGLESMLKSRSVGK
jgi:hypothetical protein